MATKSIAWNDGSGDYITLTYTGRGDGVAIAASPQNNSATARSQTITIKTTAGSPVVTRNFTINQGACPFPVGDIRNYAYTGNYHTVELPAGKYKLQVWGAQGGANAAMQEYNIPAFAGGKGGYSEGVLTISQLTKLYIFVGGKGSSSGNGGWNGGGGHKTGSSQYGGADDFGITKFGCGGGATDIALVASTMNYSNYRTNRSDVSYLSRIIVAGGGTGGIGAYWYYRTVSKQTTYAAENIADANGCIGTATSVRNKWIVTSNYVGSLIDVTAYRGCKCFIEKNSNKNIQYTFLSADPVSGTEVSYATGYSSVINYGASVEVTVPSDAKFLYVYKRDSGGVFTPNSITLTDETIDTSTWSVYGFVGGGLEGGGASRRGTQSKSNYNQFGYGESPVTDNYRFCPACSGAGWYGGGRGVPSNTNINNVESMGGGSGFVNTAANASYRPSGYTGLQLDSGTTYAGNQSFPSPSGGNETGHAGDGYARITRLA